MTRSIDRRAFLRGAGATGLAVAAVGGLNGLLAACGESTSGGPASGGGAASETGALEMWSWNGDGAYPDVHKQIEQLWVAADPANSVKRTYNDFGNYVTKLKTALAGGVPPDVVQMPWAGDYHDIIDAGKLMSLDDALGDGFPEFFKPIMDSLVYKEKTWAIPLDVNTLTIGYNTAAFDAAGVSVPTTLDELLESTSALKAAGYGPISVSAKDAWPLGDLWFAQVAYTDPSGEAIRAAERGEMGWDDPVFEQAAENVSRMVSAGLFAEGASSLDTAGVVGQFASERTAMMYPVGNFLTGLIDQTTGGKVEYDLFAFPPLEAGATPVATGGVAEMFSVPVDSKHSGAAIEFMRTATSADALKTLVENDFIPATDAADTSINDDPIYQKMTEFQETAATRVIYKPAVYTALLNSMQALMAGDASAKDVVKAMADADK